MDDSILFWRGLTSTGQWRTLGDHPQAQWCSVGPLLFLLFVDGLLNALEAMALLFADDVKMVTLRTQNRNIHSSLIAMLKIFTGLLNVDPNLI